MTTIAYTDGVMASDSDCWSGSLKVHSIQKIWKIREHLVGCAGLVGEIAAFRKWFEAGGDPEQYPKKFREFVALVVTPEGKILSFEGNSATPIEIEDEYVAIGSGDAVALGALYVGASATDAIHAAIAHSAKTGGEIQVIQLGED